MIRRWFYRNDFRHKLAILDVMELGAFELFFLKFANNFNDNIIMLPI